MPHPKNGFGTGRAARQRPPEGMALDLLCPERGIPAAERRAARRRCGLRPPPDRTGRRAPAGSRPPWRPRRVTGGSVREIPDRVAAARAGSRQLQDQAPGRAIELHHMVIGLHPDRILAVSAGAADVRASYHGLAPSPESSAAASIGRGIPATVRRRGSVGPRPRGLLGVARLVGTGTMSEDRARTGPDQCPTACRAALAGVTDGPRD